MRTIKTLTHNLIFAVLAVAVFVGCDTDSLAQTMPDEGFVEIEDGARIYYQIQGEGQPMMLIHGYPLSGDLFREQREGLSDEYQVITPTLRGYGQSETPDSTATIQTYAEDMLAVMDELGVEQAIIGGMSMGGPIIFEMYRQAPERFTGMILIDTTPAPAIPAEAGLWRGVAEQARAQGVASLVPFLIKDMLTGDTRMNNADLTAYLSGIMEEATLDAAVAGANALRTRPDSRPTLAEITVPTLIITGLEDTIYPFETAQTMADAIANSELAIPDGASHAAIIEAGTRSNEAIRDWAAGIEAGDPMNAQSDTEGQ